MESSSSNIQRVYHGVKQGNPLAAILFAFLMDAVSRALQKEWRTHSIETPDFRWLPDTETGRNLQHVGADREGDLSEVTQTIRGHPFLSGNLSDLLELNKICRVNRVTVVSFGNGQARGNYGPFPLSLILPLLLLLLQDTILVVILASIRAASWYDQRISYDTLIVIREGMRYSRQDLFSLS